MIDPYSACVMLTAVNVAIEWCNHIDLSPGEQEECFANNVHHAFSRAAWTCYRDLY